MQKTILFKQHSKAPETRTGSVVDLHHFSGSDGVEPYGSPVLDANGNLCGTTVGGGTGNGTIWEIAGVGTRH